MFLLVKVRQSNTSLRHHQKITVSKGPCESSGSRASSTMFKTVVGGKSQHKKNHAVIWNEIHIISMFYSITKSIGIFIVSDLRPYSEVESPGFKHMVATLDPRYNFPSWTHFAQKKFLLRFIRKPDLMLKRLLNNCACDYRWMDKQGDSVISLSLLTL